MVFAGSFGGNDILSSARSNLSVVNVSKVPHRSPFRYPGGKTWLVPHIRQWLRSKKQTITFVEPFAGGAIVGLSALFDELADYLILVEKDEDVAAVWRVILNGKGVSLADDICAFTPTRESVEELFTRKPRNLYERAFATIVRNRVQRGGILAPGASVMRNGENGRGLASRWYPETLRNRIVDIVKKKRRVRIVQGDGIQVLRDMADEEDTAYFIDPPYTIAGRRLYKYSDISHEDLFQAASQLRGDFLMSYDNAPQIRALAAKYAFETALVPMKNTHHLLQTELLIGKSLRWLK
jgi:DNA adenine methylase